jgi:hypothetical protein
VGYHFWLLVNEQEDIVESLYGLSIRYKVDNYGNLYPRIPRYIGTWKSVLKVYFISPPPNRGGTMDYFLTPNNKNYWIDPNRTCTKYGNDPSEKDALERWNHAKRVQAEFNNVEIPYSFCSIGKSIRVFKCKNSNSTYTTMRAILGVDSHQFEGYFSPGSKTRILPQEVMKAIAYPKQEESLGEENLGEENLGEESVREKTGE